MTEQEYTTSQRDTMVTAANAFGAGWSLLHVVREELRYSEAGDVSIAMNHAAEAELGIRCILERSNPVTDDE